MKYAGVLICLIIISTNMYANEKLTHNTGNFFTTLRFPIKMIRLMDKEQVQEEKKSKVPTPFLAFGLPGIFGGLGLTGSIVFTVLYYNAYPYNGILGGMIASWIVFGLSILTFIIEFLLVVLFLGIFFDSIRAEHRQQKIVPASDCLGIKISI